MPDTPKPPSLPMRARGQLARLLGVIVLYVAVVVGFGVAGQVRLGDEAVVIRFTQNIYQQGRLVSYDHLYEGPYDPNGVLFRYGPVWPVGLATLWTIVGTPALWIGQVWQAAWGVLLIVSTWLVGRRLNGPRAGLVAALLVATLPMVVMYSVTLYLDVPYLAVGMLGFYFLLRRWYLPAGLALAVSFLTKLNGLFYMAPALVVMGLQDDYVTGRLKSFVARGTPPLRKLVAPVVTVWFTVFAPGFLKRLLWGAMIVLPPLVAYFVKWEVQARIIRRDLATWQLQADASKPEPFYRAATPDKPSDTAAGPDTIDPFGLRNIFLRLYYKPWWTGRREKLPSSMASPVDLVTHLGVPFLVGLVWYLVVRLRGKVAPADRRISHTVFWLYVIVVLVFTLDTDIRYAMGYLVLLAVPVGRLLSTALRCRWAWVLLVLLCVGQATGVGVFALKRRRLEPETRQLFNEVVQHVEPDEYVLYPDAAMIVHAERRMVWGKFNRLWSLFWPESDEAAQVILHASQIRYIVVPHNRTYRDSITATYVNAYPQTFLDNLQRWSFTRKVDWSDDVPGNDIYRVEWTDMTRDELAEYRLMLFYRENRKWKKSGHIPDVFIEE